MPGVLVTGNWEGSAVGCQVAGKSVGSSEGHSVIGSLS